MIPGTGMMRRTSTAAILALPLLAATAQGAAAAGMPQLDFKNPLTAWQVIWGAVIFVGLYLILSRSALPRVGTVIADRQSRIDGDLEAARQAKSEADRATDELRRARREAAAEAQANLDRVAGEAREAAAAHAREMNARLDAQIQAADQQLGVERERALGSLQGIATDTARLLVERVTGRVPDPGLVASRVEGVLAGGAGAAG